MTDRPIPDETREIIDQIAADLDDIHFNSRFPSWIEAAKDIVTEAVLKAEKRGMRRGAEKVDAALKRYRARLYDIPLGHENTRRGASTYNWKVAVYEEIAAAILAEIGEG